MSEFIITHQRKVFNTDGDRATIGEVFLDGDFFCYSLEDEIRPDGVKIAGRTAIPTTTYDVSLTYSPRFKRQMILLHNDGLRIKKNGVVFEGVRVHGGNTAKNTDGCPLVAYNTDGLKIWKTAEKDLTKIVRAKIKEGLTVKWKVEVKPFNNGLDNKIA